MTTGQLFRPSVDTRKKIFFIRFFRWFLHHRLFHAASLLFSTIVFAFAVCSEKQRCVGGVSHQGVVRASLLAPRRVKEMSSDDLNGFFWLAIWRDVRRQPSAAYGVSCLFLRQNTDLYVFEGFRTWKLNSGIRFKLPVMLRILCWWDFFMVGAGKAEGDVEGILRDC